MDKVIPPGNPVREHIHGKWHENVGHYRTLTGNHEAAKVEYNRAQQKFNQSETNKMMRKNSL